MIPLVRDLATEGVPVAVTCEVRGFSRQAFYKWQANPVSDRDCDDARLVNALVDTHANDPEFGYRFPSDGLERGGHQASKNRAHRLSRQQGIWSSTTRKCHKGPGTTPRPTEHDDLVERDFTAERLDQVWLMDITEHRNTATPQHRNTATPRDPTSACSRTCAQTGSSARHSAIE
jgi:putative transposase